jgi:hypothetical protein
MGRVLKFACVMFQPLLIRLEHKFEAKALLSSKNVSRWWVFTQMLRMIQESIMNDPWHPNYVLWVQNMIDLDIRLREIVQREAFLIKQCDEAEDLLDDPKKRQQPLDEWHAEMRALGQEYWSVERMLYANDALCPTNTSWRAYVSLRDLPQWYFCTWLVEDCMRRGGCCGRACGCCSKPRSSVRPKGDGHCTKMCGCCLQSRGFPLDEEQQKLFQPNINVKGARIDDYSRCMLEAYNFGLVISGKYMSPTVHDSTHE